MSEERTITQEEFDELLAWLDANRDRAALRYEEMRHSLIKIFTWRKFNEAEDMADEVINRVTRNVRRIRPTYVGDPAPYFYKVGNNLMLEYGRRKKLVAQLEEVGDKLSVEDATAADERANEYEREQECFDRCMQQLEPDKRELIVAYFQKEKQAKIDHRKELALREKVDLNTLRVRVHRIRARLEKCIHRCLQQSSDGGAALD